MIDNSALYWIVLFLILSAFFSGSETALFSINKIQQKKLENSEKKYDKRLLKLLSQPRFLLITILLGNTLVNISISSFATLYSLYLRDTFNLDLSDSTIITIQIILTTIVILILGEIVPKLIAWAKAYLIAKIVSMPIQLIGILFWPLLKLLETFSILISKSTIEKHRDDITSEEFQTLIHSRNKVHNLEEHEKKMLAGLFRLPKAEVREIFIPRVHITAIEENQTLDDLKKLIVESGYSRIPVYRYTIDDIVGVVYAKDILLNPEVDTIAKLMRSAWFVTENMKIQSLLNQFKCRKTQIAIVVDEYGGTSGIITLEDIMEELVGEIQDEYDNDEIPLLERVNEYSIIINGMCGIREINQEFDLNIDTEQYDNIADFLLESFNKVPEINEFLEFDDKVKFTIMDSSKNRINKIRADHLLSTEGDNV